MEVQEYDLSGCAGYTPATITTRKNAKFLSVRPVNGKMVLWALIDPCEEFEEIIIVPSRGRDGLYNASQYHIVFIDTYIDYGHLNEAHVVHFFAIKAKKGSKNG
jgi:hypothetical protein